MAFAGSEGVRGKKGDCEKSRDDMSIAVYVRALSLSISAERNICHVDLA